MRGLAKPWKGLARRCKALKRLRDVSRLTLVLAFLGFDFVHVLQPARMDPRSAKPNGYSWEDEFKNSMGCGVSASGQFHQAST